MKTTITSIFFYLLIAFAVWSSHSLWPMFALLLSPVIFDSLNNDKKDDDSNDDSNINTQLNS